MNNNGSNPFLNSTNNNQNIYNNNQAMNTMPWNNTMNNNHPFSNNLNNNNNLNLNNSNCLFNNSFQKNFELFTTLFAPNITYRNNNQALNNLSLTNADDNRQVNNLLLETIYRAKDFVDQHKTVKLGNIESYNQNPNTSQTYDELIIRPGMKKNNNKIKLKVNFDEMIDDCIDNQQIEEDVEKSEIIKKDKVSDDKLANIINFKSKSILQRISNDSKNIL